MVNSIHTLIDTKPADSDTGVRGLTASSGSVILHGAVILSLLIASYLQVKPLAEPRAAIEPFILSLTPPPAAAAAAPAPPRGHAETRVAETEPPETPPEEIPDILQPQGPEEVVPAIAEDRGDQGIEDGIKDGDENGVRGGSLGGVKDGIPFGDLNGNPNGVPNGVPHGSPGPEQPIYLTGEVKPPERITFVKPDYPEVARISRTQGKVILEIVIGRTGDVEDVKILKSNPLFDEAAVDAVRMWRYKPALQSRRAVTVYLTVIVDFALK